MKIVVTGPESSGKTALTLALAQALNSPFVPEFARYYLLHLGRPYQQDDLRNIGRGQRIWEDRGKQNHPQKYLICDTDWTVLHIWETWKYKTATAWQQGYGPPVPADLYLLCAPDFPWQPDPLRENPDDREELFHWYEKLLSDHPLNYCVLKGPLEARLLTAMLAVESLSKSIKQS